MHISFEKHCFRRRFQNTDHTSSQQRLAALSHDHPSKMVSALVVTRVGRRRPSSARAAHAGGAGQLRRRLGAGDAAPAAGGGTARVCRGGGLRTV